METNIFIGIVVVIFVMLIGVWFLVPQLFELVKILAILSIILALVIFIIETVRETIH